jgi:hypothetical protein
VLEVERLLQSEAEVDVLPDNVPVMISLGVTSH